MRELHFYYSTLDKPDLKEISASKLTQVFPSLQNKNSDNSSQAQKAASTKNSKQQGTKETHLAKVTDRRELLQQHALTSAQLTRWTKISYCQQLSLLLKQSALQILWVVHNEELALEVLAAWGQEQSKQETPKNLDWQVRDVRGKLLVSSVHRKHNTTALTVAQEQNKCKVITLLNPNNSKRILGANYELVAYNLTDYALLDLAIEGKEDSLAKQLRAESLTHCVPTLLNHGKLFLFAISEWLPNAYFTYMLRTLEQIVKQDEPTLKLNTKPSKLGLAIELQTKEKLVQEHELSRKQEQKQEQNQVYEPSLAQVREQAQSVMKKAAQQITHEQFTILVGARGTGKTTLLLQIAQEAKSQGKDVFATSIAHSQILKEQEVYYLAPELLATWQAPRNSILLIDEASALSAVVLAHLLPLAKKTSIVMATTLEGYENGAGIGIWHKLLTRSNLQEHVQITIYHTTYHFRSEQEDFLTHWLRLLCGTPTLDELIEYTWQQIPQACFYQLGTKLQQLTFSKAKEHTVGQFQVRLISKDQERYTFFRLAYLTHYRFQIQDFAESFNQNQELYGLFFGQKLIGGLHLISEEFTEQFLQDTELLEGIVKGVRRPQGNLTLQTLLSYYGVLLNNHYGIAKINEESKYEPSQCKRISRIFLDSNYRGMNLIETYFAPLWYSLPYVSVMYSYNWTLGKFWQKLGFMAVWLSRAKNKNSGEYNQLLLSSKQDPALITALAQLHALHVKFRCLFQAALTLAEQQQVLVPLVSSEQLASPIVVYAKEDLFAFNHKIAKNTTELLQQLQEFSQLLQQWQNRFVQMQQLEPQGEFQQCKSVQTQEQICKAWQQWLQAWQHWRQTYPELAANLLFLASHKDRENQAYRLELALICKFFS